MTDEFKCPRCQLPISIVVDHDVQFMGCQKCYGLWVAEPDLFVYVEKAASPRVFAAFVELHELMKQSHKPGNMRECPFCKKKLGRVTFGQNPLVLLDRCEEHGLWLDRTELNKVIRSARTHSGHRPDSQENEPDDEVGPLKGAPPDPPVLPRETPAGRTS